MKRLSLFVAPVLALLLCLAIIHHDVTDYQVSAANVAAIPFRNAAVTTAVTIKSVSGTVYGYYIYNPNASICSLDFFNATSANVTLGTTVPVASLVIPASSGANLASSPVGMFGGFYKAMSVAAVTAAGGATPCGSGMTVNVFYQ